MYIGVKKCLCMWNLECVECTDAPQTIDLSQGARRGTTENHLLAAIPSTQMKRPPDAGSSALSVATVIHVGSPRTVTFVGRRPMFSTSRAHARP
jgi:hypothetical protein